MKRINNVDPVQVMAFGEEINKDSANWKISW